MEQTIYRRTLLKVLSYLLAQTVTDAHWQAIQLQGGTLGNVSLIQGEAFTEGVAWQPFQVVRKSQQPDMIELWMEYVEGVSGLNLTDDMMVGDELICIETGSISITTRGDHDADSSLCGLCRWFAGLWVFHGWR